jgi:hypothetical protein
MTVGRSPLLGIESEPTLAKRIRGFLKELKRRKVYHVAVVYAAIAFLVWQVADIAFPAIGLPDSAITLVLALSALGFPIALVLAWAYEVTRQSGPGRLGGRCTG